MEVQTDPSKSETQSIITGENDEVEKDENASTSNYKNDTTSEDSQTKESTIKEEKISENTTEAEDHNGSETNEKVVENITLNENCNQKVNVDNNTNEIISNQTNENISQDVINEKPLEKINEEKINENNDENIDKSIGKDVDHKNDSDESNKSLAKSDDSSQIKNVQDESSLENKSNSNKTDDNVESDKVVGTTEDSSNKEKSEEMVLKVSQNDIISVREKIIQQNPPCSSPETKTVVSKSSNNNNTEYDKDITSKEKFINTSGDLNDSKESGTTSSCSISDEVKRGGNSADHESELETFEDDNLDDLRPEEYGSESEEEIDEEEEDEEEDEEEEDEDEDGAISDNREGSGSSSPEILINEERQAADGQESDKKERKLDHDEDRRDPQYIPKKGMFYEHDDRTADGEEQKKESPRDTKKGKVWDSKESWTHDLYVESEQGMKSTEEIIAIYGYDIRKDDGPPKARRRRRYVKGPNKYERSWEDEQAYIKSPGRGGFRGGRRLGRGGTFKGRRNSGGRNEAGSASQATPKEFVYEASNFPLPPSKTSGQQRFVSPPREESWDTQDQKNTSNKSPQAPQQQQVPTEKQVVSNRLNQKNAQHSPSTDKGKQGNFAGTASGGGTTSSGKSSTHNNQSYHHQQRRNDDRNEENKSSNNSSTTNKGVHPLFQAPQGQPSQRGRGRGRLSGGNRPTNNKSGTASHNETNSENKPTKHNSFINNSPSSAQFIQTRSTADEDIATLAQHFSEAVINIDNKNIRSLSSNNNNNNNNNGGSPTTNSSQPSAPLKLTQVVQQHQQQLQQQQLHKQQHLQKQQQLQHHKQQQQHQQQSSSNTHGDRYKVDEATTVVDKGAEHQRSKRYSTQRQRALPPIQHGQGTSPAGPTQPQQPPTVTMPPAPPPQHVPPPPTYMHQQPPPPAYYHPGCVDSEVVAPGQVQPVEVVTFLQPPHALHYVQPQFIQTPTGPIPMQTPPPTGPEMYQGGGITYYNTLSQITQSRPNCGTSRRLKVAIPIVAPPQQDQQLQQQSSNGSGTNNTHTA